MVTESIATILLTLVVVAALVTALARSILTTLAAFGAYSLGLSVVWLVFRAPDVALTEAAVGAGVTTALFLVVVARTVGFGADQAVSQDAGNTDSVDNSDNLNNVESVADTEAHAEGESSENPDSTRDSSGSRSAVSLTATLGTAVMDWGNHTRTLSVVVTALVAGGLLLTVPALPVVGAADSPGFGSVTEYYLADSAARGIDNVVTAILVVYRGFDTFGEIAVVFTALVAAVAVLRQGGA